MMLLKVMNRDVACFISHLWSMGRMQQLSVVLSHVLWEALCASEKKLRDSVCECWEEKKKEKKVQG